MFYETNMNNESIDVKWARFLDATEKHEGFIRLEASAIEKEIGYAVKQHLVKAFKGYTLLNPINFPKYFNDPLNSGRVITELDGVYLLSNNPEVKGDNMEIQLSLPVPHDVRHELRSRQKVMNELKLSLNKLSPHNSASFETHLVIIEAKHFITKDKIERKLSQMKSIEQYLNWAKNPPDNALPKFKKNVDMYGFHKYAPRVRLYIGGVIWDDEAIKYVQTLLHDDNMKEFIGIIQPNGSRYDVYDVANLFGETQIDMYGGNVKKNKTQKRTSK